MTAAPASRVHLPIAAASPPGSPPMSWCSIRRRIADTATFEQPFQYPVGITAVIVNGAIALRDGQRAPIGTGRSLRAS